MTNLELLLGLFPEDVAIKQASYERSRQVLRAFQAGATAKEIAAKLGVSHRQAHFIRQIADRRDALPSPVERYFRNRRDHGRILVKRWMT